MPPLHPLVIHFPIALFVISLLLDAISMFTRKDTYHAASRLILVLSWIGTGVALITGDWLKDDRASFLPHGLLKLHESLAIVFAVMLTGLVILRVRKAWRPSISYLGLAGIGFLLLAAVGHTGGSMAWPSMNGQGTAAAPGSPTAVAGNTTDTNATPPDNTTANTTQTPPQPQPAPAKPSATPKSGSTTTAKPAAPSGSTVASKPKAPQFNQVLYSEGAHFFVQQCQSCHSLALSEQYIGRFSAAQWDSTVSTMQGYSGGAITNSQAQAIEYYLIHHK